MAKKLPNKGGNAIKPRKGQAAQSEETSSNAFAKVVIVLLFLVALGEAGAAVYLELNNRNALREVAAATSDEVYQVKSLDPGDLTLWEMANISKKLEEKLATYVRLREEGRRFIGEDRETETIRSTVRRAAEEIGIDVSGLGGGDINASNWNPPSGRNDLRPWRDKFSLSTLRLDFPVLSYEQAVRLTDKLETEYPWLTTTRFEINRIPPPGTRSGGGNLARPGQSRYYWTATLSFSWWNEQVEEEDD